MRINHVMALILAILLGYSISFISGQRVGMLMDRSKPVCHAITEDSDITDCDYRNGAWYRK